MTDVLKKQTLSEETTKIFAEYTIGRFLADGTQLARPFDKTEKALQYLESMIVRTVKMAARPKLRSYWI